MIGALAAVVTACVAVPAAATWHEATTRHFTVYADDSAPAVQKMADDLERLDAISRLFLKQEDVPGADANKLTIYVLPDLEAIQRLYGRGGGNVGGFYVGRASGSVAFTPRRAGSGGINELNPQIVLYHEYGHHFLLGNKAYAFPAWFSEGFAEFVSTARREDGKTILGSPANHRAYSLLGRYRLPVGRLFDLTRRGSPAEIDQLYARGWLLTHYLLMTPGGVAKLNTYLAAVNAGTPGQEAAQRAFGDLKSLDRALGRYLHARHMSAIGMPDDKLPIVPATVRELPPGQAALIRLRMESVRGVDAKAGARVYARAAAVAAGFPGDAVVQGWLAEMAFDADRLDAAAAAADRALAADPTSRQALRYRSHVLAARAIAAKATDEATWKAVRRPLLAANRLSPDDAAVLMAYYGTFAAQGVDPNASAIKGLIRAQELVPQDAGLRASAARQALVDGDRDTALRLFRPLAYNPHGSDPRVMAAVKKLEEGATAKSVLADLDAAPEDATPKPPG